MISKQNALTSILIFFLILVTKQIEGQAKAVANYAQNTNCNPNSCNIVNNGNFEKGSLCGEMRWQVNPGIVDCWENLSLQAQTYFVRGCAPLATGPMSLVTVPTGWNIPPVETWNNGGSNNNAFVGLWGFGAIQGLLSSGLLPDAKYNLSFWARVINNANGAITHFNASSDNIGYLIFAGGEGALPQFDNPLTSLPPSLVQLATIKINNNQQWNYYSMPITVTSTAQLNFISVYNAGWMVSPDSSNFTLIDDISILPISEGATFIQPPPICQTQSITNLDVFTSIVGGKFQGTGVSKNNVTGFYEFNSGQNLPGGIYPVAFSYTQNGCSRTVVQTITVTGASISSTRTLICTGESTKITASGANLYMWNTGSTNQSISVSPNITTSFTLTGTAANSCAVMQVITISVASCAGIEHKVTNLEELNIYPNPTTGELSIETNLQGRMSLIDNLGRNMIEQVIQKGTNTFDLSDYPIGVYFIKVDFEGIVRGMKIIKSE